ncbi:hypothetical protein OAL13_00705 [bacterium]|nr:hypothetical protein [bacterium]
MKGISRVVLGSVASAFLGAASFFAVDGLMPRTSEAQWKNSAGGNIYGDSRVNPMADPRVNPMADPRVNPMADPRVNPMADPRVNPNADTRVNPCGQYGC